jgi:hypothetical protein
MDSYLLVVFLSGVNPRWGDRSESAVVVQLRPRRGVTRAHSHTKIRGYGYENHPTFFFPGSHSGLEADLALPVEAVSP